jgi:hypothetical protein
MRFAAIVIAVLLCTIAMSCAPMSSAVHRPLPDVPYAIVWTRVDQAMAGPVLSENDSTITIAAYGVAQTFDKSKIRTIERDTVSHPAMVQQETLESAAQASGSATTLLVLNLVGILTTIALVVAHK